MRTLNILHPRKVSFGSEAFDYFLEDFIETGRKRLYLLMIDHFPKEESKLLEAFSKHGIQVEVDKSIRQEPSFSEFETILKKVRSFNADSVVGIGGGSVMDVAKLLAAQANNTQSTDEIKGIGNLNERQLYLACLPTTSGTGSEVSPNAILIDDGGNKVGVISPFLVPDAAYICPELTYSLPPAMTAATGIDALTHCLEAYANNYAHPIVDLYALEGIRLITEFLPIAYKEGSHTKARTQVALGSLYGGMCLGPVNTAAIHALSYPLGTEFHIAHGLSNAILLPYVMKFNLPSAISQYSNIAVAIGAASGATDEETAINGIEKIKQLNLACGIPSTLRDLNIPESAIPLLAEQAMKIQRLLKNNLRDIQLEDAIAIYKSAY